MLVVSANCYNRVKQIDYNVVFEVDRLVITNRVFVMHCTHFIHNLVLATSAIKKERITDCNSRRRKDINKELTTKATYLRKIPKTGIKLTQGEKGNEF